MNVMVVDDEHRILNGLITMIGDANPYVTKVVGALDGDEALDKLKFFQTDLLITDINMPEMSGFELIQQARSEGLCNRFVILTGYGQFDYARIAIKCQVIDYLLKPIDHEELITVLSRVSNEVKRIAQDKANSSLLNGLHDESIQPDINNAGKRTNVSEKINKIIAFIHLNYDKDITLDDISSHVNMHPNYVGSLFKKEMGMTFLSYLQNHRIHIVKRQLLLDKEKPINEIAALVGFETIRHFFKVFKKYTGISPGEFRNKYKR